MKKESGRGGEMEEWKEKVQQSVREMKEEWKRG